MDLIEFVISRLGAQVRALRDVVDPPAPNQHLEEAAEHLSRAAEIRHDHPPSAAEDNYETQAAQIARAETALADQGMNAVLNPHEAGPNSLGDVRDDRLLKLWVEIMAEFKARGVIRAVNRPLVGDYAEHLIGQALCAERPVGPDKGVDLVMNDGTTIQVKARMDPPAKRATHFDVGRLEEERFDVFVGVAFTEDLAIRGAWRLDRQALLHMARLQANGKHRIRISDVERAAAEGKAKELGI